jgi:hypothetical protein
MNLKLANLIVNRKSPGLPARAGKIQNPFRR